MCGAPHVVDGNIGVALPLVTVGVMVEVYDAASGGKDRNSVRVGNCACFKEHKLVGVCGTAVVQKGQ